MSRLRPCKSPVCTHLIDFDSRKQYCNNACRQKAYRDRKKASPIRHEKVEIRMCAFCCKTFETKYAKQRCCRAACRQALYRQLTTLVVYAGSA
jgi:hypothetical protein